MHASVESVWASACQALRSVLSREIYASWIEPIHPVRLGEDQLVLRVDNELKAVWLKDNYQCLLQHVLSHVAGRPMTVQFQVESDSPRESEPPVPRWDPPPEILRETPQESASFPSPVPTSKPDSFDSQNSFSNFVVGDNNQLAHGAALAVSQAPGKSYNPLFLYGGVGLGKTHLLHAIGQMIIEQWPQTRVAYVSSERFMNDYIAAIQENQMASFRQKYRQADVLLIDDIQFLAGKERIQEEFFHTFNALHEARNQIVVTCDRPANELKDLEQRLVSRFEWGLVTNLLPPDPEVRLAILRKKNQSLGISIGEEMLRFLAQRIRSNIRRLEGALIRVASYISMTHRPITVEQAEDLLREILQEESDNNVSIEQIQKRVAEHFDIRMSDMTSRRRPENIAFPRQIAMYLARELTDSSLMAIGDAFGGRDHGTVLYAHRQIRSRLEIDAKTRQIVQYLSKQLNR